MAFDVYSVPLSLMIVSGHPRRRMMASNSRATRRPDSDVSEARRLKALEDENARLKRMLADAMLDNVALKDLLGKKW